MAESRTQGRARLALAMAVVTAANFVVVGLLIGLPPADRVAEIASIRLGEALALGFAWTAFAVVGTVIVRHQPHNTVGWLCSAVGFQVSLVAMAVGVATYCLASDPTSPIGVAGAWISHTGSVAIIVAPLLIFFRFPTGRSLGPWWHRAEGLTFVATAFFVVLAAIEPMPLTTFPATPNPLAIGQERRIALAFAPVILSAGLAVASIIVRFRVGTPLEQRQIRLLAMASVLVALAIVTMPLTSPDLIGGGHLSTLTAVINAIAFISIPAAIGIAIVRNRLYDIDRIINRTLVYGAVSGVLVVVYAAAVLTLSPVLGAFAPGAGNTLVTAGSTLLVAALFRPVRARAQDAIDRRFDRQRYAAARMIESFSGQVRAEVGLGAIVGDLLVAAGTTVHPSSATCWLRARPPGRRALVGSGDQH